MVSTFFSNWFTGFALVIVRVDIFTLPDQSQSVADGILAAEEGQLVVNGVMLYCNNNEINVI